MFWIKEEKQTIRKCVLYLCAFLCLLCMTKKFQPEAAMVVAEGSQKCYVAIVIDDFGYDGEGTDDMIALEIPFTAAVMPFSNKSVENVEKLQAAGKEMIVHMPMESLTGKKEWVGDTGVFTSMSDEEITQCVKEAFSIVKGATGLNNHMGSAIMENERCFSAVMNVVAENELVFVDSMTTENSVGDSVCHKKGISILKRDVFLDSTDDVNVVKNQLIKTAKIAQQKGYALGIGHVGTEGGNITVQANKELAPLLEKQGIEFVTVSQLKEIISNS